MPGDVLEDAFAAADDVAVLVGHFTAGEEDRPAAAAAFAPGDQAAALVGGVDEVAVDGQGEGAARRLAFGAVAAGIAAGGVDQSDQHAAVHDARAVDVLRADRQADLG